MAKLLPINQFFDANGEPLALGKIYTYVTGGTTPKTTYTDSTGNTAHPNPVVLSAGGRAEIWLDTDTAYRIRIKDANGTQIGNDIDNVLPTSSFASIASGTNIDTTGYDIITSSGNDDIRLTPNGTGKVYINSAYKLPSSAPAAGEVLTGSGTATLTWTAPSATPLSGISDVTLTSPANGDLLKYNGSAWINSAQSTLAITASQVSDLATAAVAFSNKTGNISQWTNDSGYATASSTTTFTNKTGNISQWTNDSGYSTLTEASQAQMEAATASTVAVTPRRVQQHPGAVKAWADLTNGNPVVTNTSYNITSISRVSAGVMDVTFTTAMSSSSYGIVIGLSESSGLYTSTITNRATTGFRITLSSAADTAVRFSFVCLGDQ